MELTEDFLKLLMIGVAVVGILGIFFIFVQYNIIIEFDGQKRDAIAFGDTLLANPCLAQEEIVNGKTYLKKGLLSEDKLDDDVINCINNGLGKVTITYLDNSKSWPFEFSEPVSEINIIYFTYIEDSDGVVKMSSMEVKI